MAKELIVSVNGREKKIAIIENEKVSEFYIERGEDNQGIVGNIYKGRVMRVLPGMQSAFVDVGLERDAFLYVSDFFDEEEEFERIVIDKTKKGEAAGAERAAVDQIELARVEREQHIEATHERAEPLLEAEGSRQPAEPQTAVAPLAEQTDSARRRNRRGRRRGRGKEFPEQLSEQTLQPGARLETEEVDTPFLAGDPSIQRVVDEEEIAAVNGEMFKDARLQERIFDQIHAVEFSIEDDFRTAQVGSVLTSGSYPDASFQRVEDGDVFDVGVREPRRPETVAAHVDKFIDEVAEDTLADHSFQRVSDEHAGIEAPKPFGPRLERQEYTTGQVNSDDEMGELEEGTIQKKRAPRRSTATSSKRRSTVGRKSPGPKRRKSSNDEHAGENEIIASRSDLATGGFLEDSEARITGGRSRGEFATRRGGRRRRRPTKHKPETGGAASSNGKDEQVEARAAEEALPEVTVPEPVQVVIAPKRATRERAPTNGRGQRGFSRRDRHQPAITDLLREGQEVLVQIAKEPIAKKGARITSHIAMPGRFLVYMPTVEHVGVSRKIESDSERHRLRKLIQAIRAEEDVPSGGFIVRTAGVGVSEKELREDARYLVRTWLDIRQKAEKAKAPALVHQDLDLVQRLLRDQLSDEFEAIRVDSEDEYQRIVEFVNRIQPRLVKRVKLYTRDEPILEAFGVQAEIDKAIKPRVWLKSGGYLVINQTEALVAIDVNTGKFVGRGGGRLEDTITRTNLEAVDEIVRQIRLRDLGGIIVLDLIDMEERRNRQKVMQVLQEALRNDKSPTKVLSFNDFGLVIMTRKRVKQSLERTLCAPCPNCQGAGLIKSPQTISYEILEEARRLRKGMKDEHKQVTLRINPEVVRAIRGSERDVLTEIEEYLGPVDINSDPSIHQEQFDFAFI